MLHIIGITRAEAVEKYGIADVSLFIERCCIAQVTRVLNSAEHALRLSLLKPLPASSIATLSSFEFLIPTARSAKFAASAVMRTLGHLKKLAPVHNAYMAQLAQLNKQPAIAKGKLCPNANSGCAYPTKL